MSIQINDITNFVVPEINFPVVLNPDYVMHASALNVINDQFEISPTNQNPLFANVNNFNQNVGILQTAIKGLNEILQIGDILKNFTNPDKEILKDFTNQINSIITNTTFLNNPVFNNSIDINGTKIDLTVPKFEPEKIDLKTYFQEIEKKQHSLETVLKNLAFNTPIEKEFNPQEVLKDILKTNRADLYNLELLNMQNLQLLLS